MKQTRSTFRNTFSLPLRVTMVIALSASYTWAQSATPKVSTNPDVEVRASFAKSFQDQLSKKGMPVHVSLEGTDKSTLRVAWPRLTPQAIYTIVTSPALGAPAKSAGLKTVVFSNGRRGRWDYDLERESMLWRSPIF
jgi:hypothetical protein